MGLLSFFKEAAAMPDLIHNVQMKAMKIQMEAVSEMYQEEQKYKRDLLEALNKIADSQKA